MKVNIILLLISIFIIGINGILIGKEGDSLFGYFSDLVYDPVYFKEQQYVAINGVCTEWKLVLDHSKMMIYKTNTELLVSFKSTGGNFDTADTDEYYYSVACFISPRGCGNVHNGYQGEYYSAYYDLTKILFNLNKPYDVYFTGFSIGGAMAFIATMDFSSNHLPTYEATIKSISCITFGQPPIGDAEFNNFTQTYKSKYNYRTYINVNSNTNSAIPSNTQKDPVSYNELFVHPITPTLLNCKDPTICPSSDYALHSMDLYNQQIYDKKYSKCYNNCVFSGKNVVFDDYIMLHCRIKTDPSSVNETEPLSSLIKSYINPVNSNIFKRVPFKFSMCVFTSKKSLYYYSYSSYSSCATGFFTSAIDRPAILKDKVDSTDFNEYTTTPTKTNGFHDNDLYVVLENHNFFTKDYSFSYDISFSNQILNAPPVPTNLNVEIINGTSDLSITFDSNTNSQIITNVNSTANYNLYISKSDKNWLKFEFSESITNYHVSKNFTDIAKGYYSVIVTSDNGLESEPSNIIFINTLKQ